jgi:type I site-specific restriction endonuclease
MLTGMDKRSLSERDICTKFITPALRRAGWTKMSMPQVALSCGCSKINRFAALARWVLA